MQSGATCKLDTGLAQPCWESTVAIPPFLWPPPSCPTAGLCLGGCLVSRACFALHRLCKLELL